jgi:subtilase family serine protease
VKIYFTEVIDMVKKNYIFSPVPAVANQGQGYFPEDIKRVYNFPVDLKGKDQVVAILEFSNGYSLGDATAFWNQHGIALPSVTFVSVDGTRNDHGIHQSDEEASLDLQWLGALVPDAHILVYEASAGNTYESFSQSVKATLEYILQDTQYHPTVISISYGDAESTFGRQAITEWAHLIAQLDAKGITVCVASGDQGAYGMHNLNGNLIPHADGPATCPAAVAVGGTSLAADGSETVWSYLSPANGGASGGGYSSVFTRPIYQSSSRENARGIPDVSLNADPVTGYQIVFQGQSAIVGGTSVACPVFAAIVALANEKRAQLGKAPLSQLVEKLYGAPSTLFNDITQGNNSFNGVQGYVATEGWDACTGFGSIQVTRFIDYMASV